MEVSLVMFKSDGTRRDFAMTKDRMVIGRTSQCDLRIPLSSVSRQHCELRVVDGRLKIRDLGSSNGTYHNSTRVQEATLEPGDEVVIGPVVFKLIINGMPSSIEPVRTMIDGQVSSRPREEEPPHVAAPKPKPPMATPKPAAAIAAASASASVPAPATPKPPATPQPRREEKQESPTVDMDDPIAALEALAQAEGDIDASDSSVIDLLDDDDDDDDDKN